MGVQTEKWPLTRIGNDPGMETKLKRKPLE